MKFNNRVMHLRVTSLKKNEDLANQDEEKCATLHIERNWTFFPRGKSCILNRRHLEDQIWEW